MHLQTSYLREAPFAAYHLRLPYLPLFFSSHSKPASHTNCQYLFFVCLRLCKFQRNSCKLPYASKLEVPTCLRMLATKGESKLPLCKVYHFNLFWPRFVWTACLFEVAAFALAMHNFISPAFKAARWVHGRLEWFQRMKGRTKEKPFEANCIREFNMRASYTHWDLLARNFGMKLNLFAGTEHPGRLMGTL